MITDFKHMENHTIFAPKKRVYTYQHQGTVLVIVIPIEMHMTDNKHNFSTCQRVIVNML